MSRFLQSILCRESAFALLLAANVALAQELPPMPPAANQASGASSSAESRAPRSLAPNFIPASSAHRPPDASGFLQRWLLLEPIVKPNRTNAVFTGTYVRNVFGAEYFPGQFTTVPHDGDKVTVNSEELVWHALDTPDFNVKLFRFAYGLHRPPMGLSSGPLLSLTVRGISRTFAWQSVPTPPRCGGSMERKLCICSTIGAW